MNSDFPLVALGEVLTRSKEQVEIVPHQRYKQVTIRLWGQGVVLRDEVAGVEIAGAKRFVVRPQQFILSRIDARNGAFGLVPDLLDAAVVSNDFPAFALDSSRILPAFLTWMSKTPEFVDLCSAASEGTTNRVRLKEDRFMATKIPLPSLSTQRRIVACIEGLAARIEEARELRRQALQEVETLLDRRLEQILQNEGQHWERKALSSVAEINPSRRGNILLDATALVSFVPMAAVAGVSGTIVSAEKRTFEEVARGYRWFSSGDVIFARITPSMENGKVAVARNLQNNTGFGSTEFHVIRPGSRVLAEWLHAVVRHKPFREEAASNFTGTAGQQRVPQSFLEKKLILVPPLREQQRIIADLEDLQKKVNSLKQLQTETAAELDALIPSVLDKAFKGEL